MKRLIVAVGAVFAAIVAVAGFERVVPRSVRRAYQRASMPLLRPLVGYLPGWALLETTGRRTGRPRRVPVGGRLTGDTFWLVAGAGRDCDFVRNIAADAAVRLRVHGRWRSGTARVCPEDDARRRLRTTNPINGLFVAIAATDPLSVRVELSPSPQRRRPRRRRGAPRVRAT